MSTPRLATVATFAAGAILIGYAWRASTTADPAPPQPPAAVTAIRGVRVFDGERVLPRATVLLSGSRIQAVGADVALPDGATVIDGAGRTLLPGLIDCHTHVWLDALQRALAFGVTTELDMFMDQSLAAQLRREQAEGRAKSRADLFSAGTLVTAPGGHGTEYGLKIPTLGRPEDADAFVAARLAEGSDYIKAVFDDGAAYGLRWPTLSLAALQEVVAAARRRQRLAVVHVGSARGAEQALRAGAHGLVHLFADAEPEPGFAELARGGGAFVIPTLTVIESLAGGGGGALADDPRLAEWLGVSEKRQLKTPFPMRRKLDAAIAARTVKRLADAGVDVLAGTDAPNPGTTHGASLHRELELLVAAGLTPLQALRSATSVPARVFSLADRGRIEAGRRADLLLVDGDPTRDITATRAVAMVFKEGVRAARERPAAAAVSLPVADGRVSDFEEVGEPQARFGSGWHPSSDERMGGKSEVRLERATPGAGASKGALRILGVVRAGSPYPWAGAMFFPGGPDPSSPADLSAFRALRFRARGDDKGYRVMLFATRLGSVPAAADFQAGREWRLVTLQLSAFGSVDGQGGGLDGSDLWGLLFAAGADEGEFRLEIDDVAFVKEP